MDIIEKNEEIYSIKIHKGGMSSIIKFSPDSKNLEFLDQNYITEILKQNEYQLRKILHNKRKDTFFPGFQLKFAITDKKEVSAFNEKSKIIVLDKRSGNIKIYATAKGEENIYKIYTDGCFLEKQGKGGYAALTQNLKGQYNLYTGKTSKKSSNLTELLAPIKG